MGDLSELQAEDRRPIVLRRDLADLAENDATESPIQMFQTMVFRTQMSALNEDEADAVKGLAQLGRALRDMVASQKVSAGLRLKVAAQVRAELKHRAVAALDRIGRDGGAPDAEARISPAALRRIREEIYGVFDNANIGDAASAGAGA